MKMKKLLTGMLASVVAVSAFACSNISASAEAFTPTATNFHAVFDFDSVPDAYQVGQAAPGSRRDTVGGKDTKCVTADGVGLTYKTSIVTDSAQSGNALRIDVTDKAPEAGSYCPVTFNCNHGNNQQNDVRGAKYFAFWVDASKFKDPDTGNTKSAILYIQETNVDANGDLTAGATAWKPKKGSEGGTFEYQAQGTADWVTAECREDDFVIPAGFVGWIRFDLSQMVYTDWTGAERNPSFLGNSFQAISLGMGNYARQAGSSIVFDSFGFIGDFQNKPADNTPAATNNVGTTTTSNGGDATIGTDSTVSGDASSSDVSSDASSDASSKKSSSKSSSSSKKTTNADTKDGGSLLWLWITLGVVVVLVAGGTCFYFFYVKPKNPDFFKNLFKKNKSEDAEKKDDK